MSVVHWLLSWFLVYPSRAPELDFMPKPNSWGSSLIWIRPNNTDFWVNSLTKSLNEFESSKNYDFIQDCPYDRPPAPGRTCNFDLNHIRLPCTKENDYGYKTGHPCIFLTIKPNPGYTARFYNSSVLPKNMPLHLKRNIREAERRGQENVIWVTCDGEYAFDQENIGPIVYLPLMGFKEKFFPEQKVDHYVSPMVAVFFENPEKAVAINVVCKLWAPNIQYEDDKNLGIVRFQLMID